MSVCPVNAPLQPQPRQRMTCTQLLQVTHTLSHVTHHVTRHTHLVTPVISCRQSPAACAMTPSPSSTPPHPFYLPRFPPQNPTAAHSCTNGSSLLPTTTLMMPVLKPATSPSLNPFCTSTLPQSGSLLLTQQLCPLQANCTSPPSPPSSLSMQWHSSNSSFCPCLTPGAAATRGRPSTAAVALGRGGRMASWVTACALMGHSCWEIVTFHAGLL
jgi:hypothetical protein